MRRTIVKVSMSDTVLRLIPNDPQFEPRDQAVQAALRSLETTMPKVVVKVIRYSEIRFVDPGSNFERVLCPRCSQEITGDWKLWMDKLAQVDFVELSVVTPCCHTETSLNELVYQWPAGFARFALELVNPAPPNWLPDSVRKHLETDLGCGVRQILAHY